ncbi:type III pantothenate kinase [Mycoplasma sp. P36-A1]|uniref:type III pantothenate kinase n=1 Tax=Mycoplasma sp. P36-A1 TaxID=3252900 RepID=UPI003C2F31FB
MKLAINIGNSYTKIAYQYQNENIILSIDNTSNFNLTINDEFLKENKITEVVICSVVESVLTRIVTLINRIAFDIEINIVNRESSILDYSKYHNMQLGLDRIIACDAVNNIYQKDTFLLIDFGTATTINLVINKVYEGGLIIPGVKTQYNSLIEHTTLRPEITLNNKNNSLLGLSTQSNIDLGIKNMINLAIENLINKLKIKYEIDIPIYVIGGNNQIIDSQYINNYTLHQNIVIDYLLNM